jgi:transposase
VIERSFNTIKNWHGLATRYDKLALAYRAAALLAAICARLRHLRATPAPVRRRPLR